jgi:hypothetical protein
MIKKTVNNSIKKAKKIQTHVCSECLDDFNSKQIFFALAPTGDHRTLYCIKCINELKIKEYFSYSNSKMIVEEESDIKKSNPKKTPIIKKLNPKKTTKKIVSKRNTKK